MFDAHKAYDAHVWDCAQCLQVSIANLEFHTPGDWKDKKLAEAQSRLIDLTPCCSGERTGDGMTFTKGPWAVEKAMGTVRGVDGTPVASVLYAYGEYLSNAQLIAAAPELYAALEEAKNHLENELGEWLPVNVGELPTEILQEASLLHDQVTAALAKARGEWTADQILAREA